MESNGLQKITPESLSDHINLNFVDEAWMYSDDEGFTIPRIQAEGAAKVWNLLIDKGIALLADEVGMGKTIQALSAMATLWQQKSDAKVLLYAPNENVARKWIREYNNFIRYHYRHPDNLVKSAIHGMPLRKALYCENHVQLLEYINLRWPSFIVCKTSSLSGFMSPRITSDLLMDIGLEDVIKPDEKSASEEEILDWMSDFGIACNQRAYELLSSGNHPPFDLIVFDEAHYLRRSEGDSNRSIAAHAFFAGRNIRAARPFDSFSPLARMALLLTATPNHSSREDVRSITSLFRPEFRQKDPADILRDICVRRFRRLANKTKHDYREEIAAPVKMEHLRERLFFAAYHKALVKAKAEDQHRSRSKQDNPYRVLFGYLEGFEFLPSEYNAPTRKQTAQRVEGTDFIQRDDTKVIVELSGQYLKAYNHRPDHPKYRKILEWLQPVSDNIVSFEKKLVFVRRIASVKEISHRVNELYDDMMSEHIERYVPPGQLEEYRKNPRAYLHQLAKGDSELEELKEEATEIPNEIKEEGVGESKILGLFTVKKEGRFRSTDCSNFRLRFLKKETIFSVFFEPPSDYLLGEYNWRSVAITDQDKRDYQMTARETRLASSTISESDRILLETHFDIVTALERSQGLLRNITTLIKIWLSCSIQNVQLRDIISTSREVYLSFSAFEKEGFSQFLEKGVLFSSEHIVRFYGLYRSIMEEGMLRGEDLYMRFCQKVEDTIETSGLAALIGRAVDAFRIFYKKELGHTEEALLNESWSFLNNTMPAYPVSGETNRDSIRKAFNTPFYPNVLIATSVLQEGVDLHYQCSEVIHYGIAWTQGDNEQRVGRVDRMFGKMEEALSKRTNATLPIHYPYLQNTIDHEQVGRFIKRKHDSEKLLDRLQSIDSNTEINLREETEDDVWMKYLNTPGKNTFESDPFPVDYNKDFAGVSAWKPDRGQILDRVEAFLEPLINSIHAHFGDEFVLLDKKTLLSEDKRLFAIRHIRPNLRHQPVIGEFGYSEEGFYFTRLPIYYIRILTPLARNARRFDEINRKKIIWQTYRDNPLLKICLDRKGKDAMKYYVSADLPLFRLTDGNYNLSRDEIIDAIQSVITFADELEQVISNRDISNESVITGGFAPKPLSHSLLKENRQTDIRPDWLLSGNSRYLYREMGERFQDYDQLYDFNHHNLFLRKIQESRVTKKQVGVYRHDALEQECDLLEKLLFTSLA